MLKSSSRIDGISMSAIGGLLERAAREGWTDAIAMAGGEPRFPIPPGVRASLSLVKEDRLTKYSPFRGYDRLIELIAAKLQKVNGINADPSRIIVVPGGASAVFATLSVLVDPGDEVIITDPCWEHYPSMVRLVHAVPVPFELTGDSAHLTVDLDRLESLITARTRAILLNSPLNPWGSIMRESELRAIASLCDRHGIALVSDEEYETFAYDGVPHCAAAAIHPEAISLFSFSKSFALTGIRLGYIAGPEQTINALKKQALYSYIAPASPSQVMAEAVLEADYEAFLVDVRKAYQAKRDLLAHLLQSIDGVSCLSPEGGLYLFPRVTVASGRAAEVLVDQQHLLCLAGDVAGTRGVGRVRLFFGVPDEAIIDAADRIGRVVASPIAASSVAS